MNEICAATSDKKGSHHRLGGRNAALFFYWQGIRVVATLTFEKVLILGRVAAVFSVLTLNKPRANKADEPQISSITFFILILIPCLPAGRLVPLFFIHTRCPGCKGPE